MAREASKLTAEMSDLRAELASAQQDFQERWRGLQMRIEQRENSLARAVETGNPLGVQAAPVRSVAGKLSQQQDAIVEPPGSDAPVLNGTADNSSCVVSKSNQACSGVRLALCRNSHGAIDCASA